MQAFCFMRSSNGALSTSISWIHFNNASFELVVLGFSRSREHLTSRRTWRMERVGKYRCDAETREGYWGGSNLEHLPSHFLQNFCFSLLFGGAQMNWIKPELLLGPHLNCTATWFDHQWLSGTQRRGNLWFCWYINTQRNLCQGIFMVHR